MGTGRENDKHSNPKWQAFLVNCPYIYYYKICLSINTCNISLSVLWYTTGTIEEFSGCVTNLFPRAWELLQANIFQEKVDELDLDVVWLQF